MSNPHYAHGCVLEIHPHLPLQDQHGGMDVLSHGRGVAARAIGPFYASLLQISGVQMVISDGGGGDEADAASLQQGTVAKGTGPHNQNVCIADILRGYLRTGQKKHLVHQILDKRTYVGYFIVDNCLHIF